MNEKTASVRIPDYLRKKLRQLATSRDTTLKELMKDAVAAYLANPPKEK